MKILIYDLHHGSNYSMKDNERAKAVFMARDDRIYRMTGIKNKPDSIQFITNHLFTNNIVGESEIIQGDVILVVDQGVNNFRLPYALRYNKTLRKPELFIEKSIERVKDILEANNDIGSDTALLEYLRRKGIQESSVWILSVLVKSTLSKQICQGVILANTIKRIVDKEVFVMSNIQGKPKIPGGIYATQNEEGMSPLFIDCITFVIETILQNNLEEESKLAKHVLMTLFFYRLESLPFNNSLQFDTQTKDYLQGMLILKDILKVSVENPLLFLKTVQNICNVKFSLELLRKGGVDKYIINCRNPLQIETESDELNVNAELINYAPVSVRERIYFVMATFISTREYMDEETEQYSKQTDNSSSVKNSYLDDEEDSSCRESSSSNSNIEDGSNESYDSVASLNRNNQDSPPFKQGKAEKNESKVD